MTLHHYRLSALAAFLFTSALALGSVITLVRDCLHGHLVGAVIYLAATALMLLAARSFHRLHRQLNRQARSASSPRLMSAFEAAVAYTPESEEAQLEVGPLSRPSGLAERVATT